MDFHYKGECMWSRWQRSVSNEQWQCILHVFCALSLYRTDKKWAKAAWASSDLFQWLSIKTTVTQWSAVPCLNSVEPSCCMGVKMLVASSCFLVSSVSLESDAKHILTAPPLENWRRPPGCSHTTRMKTTWQDLKSVNLSLNEAIDVAQNHPLWRSMSTLGTMHW